MINIEKLELSAPEKKGMKNDKRDENPLVEIVDKRLKRLHTNEIDARIETQAPGRRAWEGGKQRQL